jgi:hypothetical protein
MKNPTLLRINNKVQFHDQHHAGFDKECVVICKIKAIWYNEDMKRWEAWLQDHSLSEPLDILNLHKDYDCTKWQIGDGLIFPDGSSGVVEKIQIYFGHDPIMDRCEKIFYSVAGKFKLIDQEDL